MFDIDFLPLNFNLFLLIFLSFNLLPLFIYYCLFLLNLSHRELIINNKHTTPDKIRLILFKHQFVSAFFLKKSFINYQPYQFKNQVNPYFLVLNSLFLFLYLEYGFLIYLGLFLLFSFLIFNNLKPIIYSTIIGNKINKNHLTTKYFFEFKNKKNITYSFLKLKEIPNIPNDFLYKNIKILLCIEFDIIVLSAFILKILSNQDEDIFFKSFLISIPILFIVVIFSRYLIDYLNKNKTIIKKLSFIINFIIKSIFFIILASATLIFLIFMLGYGLLYALLSLI